jgi:hypothetical protein
MYLKNIFSEVHTMIFRHLSTFLPTSGVVLSIKSGTIVTEK